MSDCVVLYPVYAVLFADSGLSGAQISSLFAIWSITSFALEVPSGVWADLVSRRTLLIVASLAAAAAFALWTAFPSYPAFAAGFVLWGGGLAMRSGSFEALAYEELGRSGASAAYPRVLGRARASGTAGMLLAGAAAAPVLKAGGYPAAGIASVVMALLGGLVAWRLPESRPAGTGRSGAPADLAAPPSPPGPARPAGPAEAHTGRAGLALMREGLSEVRAHPVIRRTFLIVALLSGGAALDEYIPLLAESTGAALPVISLLVLLTMVGMAAGEWLAGRATRAVAPIVALGALALAGGAAIRHPAGFVLIAVAFGTFYWAMTGAEARLQEHLTDRTRATVTSMVGFGAEAAALLVFAGYGLGSAWAGPRVLFAVAAVPYLAVAFLLRRPGVRTGPRWRRRRR